MTTEDLDKPIVRVFLESGALDQSDALQRFSSLRPKGCGGEATFAGRIRPETDAAMGELLALEYEAYMSMVVASVEDSARDICAKNGASAAMVIHSVGRVDVGGASVLVQVAAAHRAPALRACKEIIEDLKHRAPVWKREIYRNGSRWQTQPTNTGKGVTP